MQPRLVRGRPTRVALDTQRATAVTWAGSPDLVASRHPRETAAVAAPTRMSLRLGKPALAFAVAVVLFCCLPKVEAEAKVSGPSRVVATKVKKKHPKPPRKKRKPLTHKQKVERKAKRVIRIAKRYLGVSYRLGGSSPRSGFDCSRLVRYVYRRVGIRLPAGRRRPVPPRPSRQGRQPSPRRPCLLQSARPRRHVHRWRQDDPRPQQPLHRQNREPARLLGRRLRRRPPARLLGAPATALDGELAEDLTLG